MRFQLLCGMYGAQDGTLYQAPPLGPNGQPAPDLPVVVSDMDLVDRFGPQRFRRLPDEPEPVTQTKPPLIMTVASGAIAVAPEAMSEPAEGFGDVTAKFPRGQAAGLRVYRQASGAYLVTDATGSFASDHLKRRIAVHQFIKQRLGG